MENEFKAFEGLSILNFGNFFNNEESCKEYLFQVKFGKGFSCTRCNHTEAYKGSKPFTMICKSCKYSESSTSNTLFHKNQFGLVKAFHIIYDMTTTPNGISANHAAKKYEIKYDNIWLFMKKVRVSMESTANFPMTGKVYIDEFVIGGYEKGAVGRKNKSKKIKMIMAVETTDKNKIKRVYTMKIDDYSGEELRKIFEKHISKEAKVYTDEWRGYWSLMEEWNIVQNKKYKTKSPVNLMIQQAKSWLRGTHHSVSSYHVETYLNEFCYRINRSQWKDTVFHKCVERMVNHDKKNSLQLSKKVATDRKDIEKIAKQYVLWQVPFKVDVKHGKLKLKMVA